MASNHNISPLHRLRRTLAAGLRSDLFGERDGQLWNCSASTTASWISSSVTVISSLSTAGIINRGLANNLCAAG